MYSGLVAAALLALAASSGATGGSSTAENPTVTFATPGAKTVTLEVCNAFKECSSVTKTVQVLDPGPAITAMTVTPARIVEGRSLLLAGQATGEPPLNFAWEILANGLVVGTAFGANASFLTNGLTPGAYLVELLVSNAFGTAMQTEAFAVAPSSLARYYTVVPCRVLDTRATKQAVVAPGPPLEIGVAGVCGIPATAVAVTGNVTAVAPTSSGYVSVYPADLAYPPVSSVDFAKGATRATAGVWPLSEDGAGKLAATASLAAAGSVELLLDVSGYFASSAGSTAPGVIEMQARLCAFGFCDFAAGTEIFFSEEFSGTATEYLYDWTGSGVFTDSSPVPIKSHVYASAAGTVTPTVKVVSDSSSAVLAQTTPMYIGPTEPASLPGKPSVVSVSFAGYVTSSAIDPTLTGLHPAYQVAIASPPLNLLGYNVYASLDGAPYALVAALQPTLPASEPLVVANFTPPGDSLEIVITAVNFAGEGQRTAPIALTHP